MVFKTTNGMMSHEDLGQSQGSTPFKSQEEKEELAKESQ